MLEYISHRVDPGTTISKSEVSQNHVRPQFQSECNRLFVRFGDSNNAMAEATDDRLEFNRCRRIVLYNEHVAMALAFNIGNLLFDQPLNKGWVHVKQIASLFVVKSFQSGKQEGLAGEGIYPLESGSFQEHLQNVLLLALNC